MSIKIYQIFRSQYLFLSLSIFFIFETRPSISWNVYQNLFHKIYQIFRYQYLSLSIFFKFETHPSISWNIYQNLFHKIYQIFRSQYLSLSIFFKFETHPSISWNVYQNLFHKIYQIFRSQYLSLSLSLFSLNLRHALQLVEMSIKIYFTKFINYLEVNIIEYYTKGIKFNLMKSHVVSYRSRLTSRSRLVEM